MFRRILIANRGEIAVRIARACRDLGVESVAVCSDADRDALHVIEADRAVHIGAAPATDSYLRVEAILEAAASTDCDAVHPGYGFLAENAAFARAVGDSGLVFIGPAPLAIEAMGDKIRAREIAGAAGVPLPPAATIEGAAKARAAGDEVGMPLLVKAAGGGGGKGMRTVRETGDLASAIEAARREARAAFGDDRVYLERLVEGARHIEIQVLADQHGNCIHLGERECSIQRRHQKIVEESPSPAVDQRLRAQLTTAALSLARAVDYRNAGTVEFLLDGDANIYFLEMNTRLQVEHPVTEWVTGIDMVQAQIRIAANEPLWVRQSDIEPRGHAIECRLYAEDAQRDFAPSSAAIELLRAPAGPWTRFDSGIREGFVIPLEYDPMMAKLSVWGACREDARRRMVEALRELALIGPSSTGSFLIDVLQHPAFASGATNTSFLDQHMPSWTQPTDDLTLAAAVAALHQLVNHSPSPSTAAGEPSPWQTLGSWRSFGDGGSE